MNANDLYQYHGAAVWTTLDGRKTLMRLYSRPLHDPYLFVADPDSFKNEPSDRPPEQTFVLTKTQIESFSLREPGVVDSHIEFTGQPQGTRRQEDIC